MPTYRLEDASVDRLKENPQNPKIHSTKQIRRLAKSMSRVALNPIAVDETYMVLAGHARLKAAKLNGMSVVPVVIISGLSEAQKRAFLIADNKVAEGSGWDRKMLAAQIEELTPSPNGNRPRLRRHRLRGRRDRWPLVRTRRC
ncbi:ParB/Srx family N-terminal domain-containing protein [Methyloceanibacter sp.]|uniref:ParB/Srx family N-terminal domain-containing protein n=1 Tax=Methyloceanibacter sp. TaxID=1965321 RepID=UPI002D4AF6E0|nr:ParB/Srx family N-terminal domain-containing protein [Methyloceanibacter sp.]HZP08279.1 ParB/Srx family N-terminal domain-containing protein [Methyloceanibacter sp.]